MICGAYYAARVLSLAWGLVLTEGLYAPVSFFEACPTPPREGIMS